MLSDDLVRRQVLNKLYTEAATRGDPGFEQPAQADILNGVDMGRDEASRKVYDSHNGMEQLSQQAMLTAVAEAYATARAQAAAELAAQNAGGGGGGGGGGHGGGGGGSAASSFIVPATNVPSAAEAASILGGGLTATAPAFPTLQASYGSGAGQVSNGTGEAARNGHAPALTGQVAAGIPILKPKPNFSFGAGPPRTVTAGTVPKKTIKQIGIY